MQLSEKEIENFIYSDLYENDGYTLAGRGFMLSHLTKRDYAPRVTWVRQLDLGHYGIADVVGFYRYRGVLYAELIELKARPIEVKDFEQISRYEKALHVFLRNTFKSADVDVLMTLVGTGYSGMYLHNLIPVDVYTVNYDLSGLTFEKHGKYSSWHIPSERNRNIRHVFERKQKMLALNGVSVH